MSSDIINNEEDTTTASFLASIAEVRQRREQQDMERIKALEDDIAARRKRREERARSISPDKPAQDSDLDSPNPQAPSNALTSPPSLTPSTSAAAMDAHNAPNGPPSPTRNVPEFTGFKSVRSSASSANVVHPQASEQSGQASPSATTLARRGTLSWQQRRPQSRGGSRPTSAIGADNTNAGATNAHAGAVEPSREEIAASLSKRDPGWFRQTADRGIGSAAYRRSQDDVNGGDQPAMGRRGLPGMQREPSKETEQKPVTPAEQEGMKSGPTSRSTSVRDSGTSSHRLSTSTATSTTSKPDIKSLIAADSAQQEASPMSEGSSTGERESGLGRTLTMSSSQARIAGSTERPGSPTKGMGGFVSSAMMKRSESVNKRWSAQPGGSLERPNSVTSSRSGYGGLQGSYSMPKLEPTPGSRESSHEPTSRPTSSSSNLTNLTMTQGGEQEEPSSRPPLSRHARSRSVISSYGATGGDEGATSPPGSPSKRFSPTKSSWLESSLTRPESPKPATAKNAQPSWMANIAKAKAQRNSVDSTPRPGTPKAADEGSRPGSRPGSPTKAPFGQGMLKRSDSRDLGLPPRSSTPPFMKDRPQTPTQKPVALQSEDKPPEVETTLTEEPTLEAQAEQQNEVEPISEEPTKAQEPTKQSQSSESALPSAEPESAKSPPVPVASKPKVEPPSKPEPTPKLQTDFRSTLRSRPLPEAQKQEKPEFLSKFGNLRKAQTEKYVAPDIFRANIERGKADLTKTGGPVKTPRRDELRESLIAKKDDWQKAKEEGRELPGQMHERKISANAPITPGKPEALTRRGMLNRSESHRSFDKSKESTPEALARHKSLKDKPKIEPPPAKQTSEPVPSPAPSQEPTPSIEPLARHTSEPAAIPPKQNTETSKMAARFNPGLANILARGPPANNSGSNTPSRAGSPSGPGSTAMPAAPPGEPKAGEPLQDMRKGRARGPKKRQQGGKSAATPAQEQTAVASQPKLSPEPQPEPEPAMETPAPLQPQKPRAPPGSAASVMMASLRGTPKPQESPQESEKPSPPVKKPSISVKPAETSPAPSKDAVPEFKGFGSFKKTAPSSQADDNKENSDDTAPAVKSASSFWVNQSAPKRAEAPPQIQLPSKKDEEAAMRSAGLLASSPARTGSTPPASTGAPPKPSKPSRVVSGQLGEASPNRGVADSVARPTTETEHLLAKAFGLLPIASKACAVDTLATVAAAATESTDDVKTVRTTMHELASDGTLKAVPPRQGYMLFDESVYVCAHTAAKKGIRFSQVFVWHGNSATAQAKDQAQTAARKVARENSAQVQTIQQAREPQSFLQALGGILITRRGAREGAPKQYLLCGRKHLGHITFDEMDFGIHALCPGFVYLISFPVTLQETKLYLWKGSACSMEETSAARLAAMDLSETGEIIEVDNGAEFASFLKIFGRGTMKLNIPKATQIWRQKAEAPERFEAKLFRVQQPEQKGGIFAMFTRRPSWNTQSRSNSPYAQDVKVEVKYISPFTQADLDAEGIYILDAYSELLILLGSLFTALPDPARSTLLGQTLLFAQEYVAAVAAERPAQPKGSVIFHGVPQDLKMLFRHWDDSRGLWGTAGLMAGSSAFSGSEVKMAALEEVAKAVCRE